MQNQNQSSQQQQPRERLKWEPVKLFVVEEATQKFAVRVSKLPLGRPQYTCDVGVMLPPKIQATANAQPRPTNLAYDPATWRFSQYIKFNLVVNNGVVYSSDNPLPEQAIAELLATARKWIEEQAQQEEDAFMEKRRQRELRSVNFGKQEVRVTGKTARKHGKQPTTNNQ